MSKTIPFEERFWAKVEKTDGCWIWTAFVSPRGYGTIHRAKDARPRTMLAHRAAYELIVGPIPDGKTLDHLCRNRRCVNPAHLEPVTHRENILRGEGLAAQEARQTHCKRGHPLTEENIYRYKSGSRACKKCAREVHRARRDERRRWLREQGLRYT